MEIRNFLISYDTPEKKSGDQYIHFLVIEKNRWEI